MHVQGGHRADPCTGGCTELTHHVCRSKPRNCTLTPHSLILHASMLPLTWPPPSCAYAVVDTTVTPQLAGLTSGSLSGWGCSTHGAFSQYASSFLPMAVAGTDRTAPPYIIARGDISSSLGPCDGYSCPPNPQDPAGLCHGAGAAVLPPPGGGASFHPPFCRLTDTPHVDAWRTACMHACRGPLQSALSVTQQSP